MYLCFTVKSRSFRPLILTFFSTFCSFWWLYSHCILEKEMFIIDLCSNLHYFYSPNVICYKIAEKICDQFNNAFILMVSHIFLNISYSVMLLGCNGSYYTCKYHSYCLFKVFDYYWFLNQNINKIVNFFMSYLRSSRKNYLLSILTGW